MASLTRNLRNRHWLLDRLTAEVIGPDPADSERAIVLNWPDAGQDIRFSSWDEFRRPKVQADGEELLWQDPPLKRYGAGVLFPAGVTEQTALAQDAASTPDDIEDEEPGADVRADEALESQAGRTARKTGTTPDEFEDYDVSLANAWRPSALGVSVLVDLERESEGIEVQVGLATYRRASALIDDPRGLVSRDLWFRFPVHTSDEESPVVRFTTSELSDASCTLVRIEKKVPEPGAEGIRVSVVSRPWNQGDNNNTRLLTVCVVNRNERGGGRLDERCYFQCGLKLKGLNGNRSWILPYPEVTDDGYQHEEDRIVALLYRDRRTFAIGHGCAADWSYDSSDEFATSAWTTCLPHFELPSISASVEDAGRPIRVSMRALAGLDASDDGFGELNQLLEAYARWIEALNDVDSPRPVMPNVTRSPIPENLKNTARLLIDRCRNALARMREGLAFLSGDGEQTQNARIAFRLANEALYLVQLRKSPHVRSPSWDNDTARFVWDMPFPDLNINLDRSDVGFWRPFQIAFLLMSIRGICDPSHKEREIVDLIWFPTGGGKTEAYLALTAFTIFFNRLAGLRITGADVIMRYTLRLLTAQQFERAGLLFCAMEDIRRRRVESIPGLGPEPFRLGMWVGGDAAPNTRQQALSALSALNRNPDSENPFVLLRCPWCGAVMGPHSNQSESGAGRRRRGRTNHGVLGYKEARVPNTRTRTVVYRCPDSSCPFGTGNSNLPIVVIDEDIYDDPPNLIIGTVDKFAMLAWKPEIRRIFAIDDEGNHDGCPPTLVIQDELHLISGPLGSMVGAYETVIEQLCTSRNGGELPVRPKVVASTATISRATEQIGALYARNEVQLFPPSGLEAGDSFFAREARDDNGELKPGRLYAGVMAPGHGSLQTTQARLYAVLLQNPATMPILNGDESERDPWWTLVCFYNSLRELGGAATLLVADARDYLRVVLDRHGHSYSSIRQLLNWIELTSRIRSDQVPRAIQQLQAPFARDRKGFVKDTIDACLASNIIEVGIDIERLSLMAIIGQPKTTSQYIQVSSRIGRNPEAPGLVVTVYSAAKPRDRSHYERFLSYHQSLYAQVEPTSVTPFSPPAVDRALHGIVAAAVRQLGQWEVAISPRPFPIESGTRLRTMIETMIANRSQKVDPTECNNVSRSLGRRLAEWRAWDPETYGHFGAQPENPPLMHPAGTHEREEWNGHSWATLSSLRNVDATCEADITMHYQDISEEETE